jgi:hypothetical protein
VKVTNYEAFNYVMSGAVCNILQQGFYPHSPTKKLGITSCRLSVAANLSYSPLTFYLEENTQS